MNRKIVLFFLCILVGMIAGCGSQRTQAGTHTVEHPSKEDVVQNDKPQIHNDKSQMLDSPEFLYDYVEMKPAVIVDICGYEIGSDKEAVVTGKTLPTTFDVCDCESGDVVFHGMVRQIACTEDDEIITGICTFTDFDTEGKYYIWTDTCGKSYSFEIKEDIYSDLTKQAFAKLHSMRNTETEPIAMENDSSIMLNVNGGWNTAPDGRRDVTTGCLTALDLMMAYEYHPKAFSDDFGIEESGNKIPDILDEIRFETDWLMSMMNVKTGGVYDSVSIFGEDTDSPVKVIVKETTKATAYACTALARFSYIYKKFDSDYCNKCMNAAGKAWKCLAANKDIVAPEQMYRAAVEMYRATGYGVYKSVIVDFNKANAGNPYSGRITMDAALSYLDTPRNIEVDHCTKLMSEFMSETEAKANMSRQSRYMVESADTSDMDLLRNAVEFVMVDYIVASKEYATIEEDYLHYLCGRNPNAAICDAFADNPDAYAQFVLVAGKLMTDR